jgi:transcriptional regulator with XRE-family HTH domain
MLSGVASTSSARYREFLKRLKRARKVAGLTQVEVARALGKHQSYVTRCETGERRVDVIELVAFAELYGRSLRYFVPPR